MANIIRHSDISLPCLLLKQISEIISFLLHIFQHTSLKNKETYNHSIIFFKISNNSFILSNFQLFLKFPTVSNIFQSIQIRFNINSIYAYLFSLCIPVIHLSIYLFCNSSAEELTMYPEASHGLYLPVACLQHVA